MKPLSEVKPHIRAAHMYNYRGAPEEQRRRGYSYAFHLFTEGHGHMIVNEQVYPVASGSLIFVRPGEGHYFVPAPGDTMDACNIYCDLWCVPQPKQPTFAYQWDDYDPRWLTEEAPCSELDALPTSMSLRPYPHLIELIKQTLAAFNRSGKYTAQAVSACFYSWILQWHEAGSLTQTADYRITRILEQMEACPERRFSVDYWCSECGLEKSQFYRLFKQENRHVAQSVRPAGPHEKSGRPVDGKPPIDYGHRADARIRFHTLFLQPILLRLRNQPVILPDGQRLSKAGSLVINDRSSPSPARRRAAFSRRTIT